MGRYQFYSPGAAAGDSIVELLAQRRAEARQAMLDQITKQRFDVEAADSEERRKATEEEITSSKDARDRANYEEARKGWRKGKQVDTTNMDPAIVQRGIRLGHIGPKPAGNTPVVESSSELSGIAGPLDPESVPIEGNTTPENVSGVENEKPPVEDPNSKYYLGDAGEQEKEDRRNRMGDLLSKVLANPNMTDREMAVLFAGTADDPNIDAGLYNMMRTPRQRKMYDPNTNKFIELPPGSEDLSIVPWKPREAQDRTVVPGYVSEDGHPVTFVNGVPHVMDPNTMKLVPYGGKIGAKPTSGRDNMKGPAAAEFIKLIDLKKKIQGGILFGASKADKEAFDQGVANIASRYPGTTSDIVDTLLAVLDDEKSMQVPTDQLIEHYKQAFPDPKELGVFRQLLLLSKGN